MDSIFLSGIACRVRLGVPDAERRRPQRVLIDLELRLDLEKAGATDDPADTVDYWEAERRVRTLAESGEYRLVERLASAVAGTALELDGRIVSVRVAVRKRPKAMPKTGEVAVALDRSRP